MSDLKPDQEPSIEEILESIRQIISDDSEAAADKAGNVVLTAPEEEAPLPAFTMPEPKAEAPIKQSNVVDLTEVVSEPAYEIDMQEAREMETPDMAEPFQDENSLLSQTASAAATDAMSKLLAGNVAVDRDEPSRPGRVTLEDMALELMRPLIKTWLDQNLPAITEKIVTREVEKISRRAADR